MMGLSCSHQVDVGCVLTFAIATTIIMWIALMKKSFLQSVTVLVGIFYHYRVSMKSKKDRQQLVWSGAGHNQAGQIWGEFELLGVDSERLERFYGFEFIDKDRYGSINAILFPGHHNVQI